MWTTNKMHTHTHENHDHNKNPGIAHLPGLQSNWVMSKASMRQSTGKLGGETTNATRARSPNRQCTPQSRRKLLRPPAGVGEASSKLADQQAVGAERASKQRASQATQPSKSGSVAGGAGGMRHTHTASALVSGPPARCLHSQRRTVELQSPSREPKRGGSSRYGKKRASSASRGCVARVFEETAGSTQDFTHNYTGDRRERARRMQGHSNDRRRHHATIANAATRLHTADRMEMPPRREGSSVSRCTASSKMGDSERNSVDKRDACATQ